MQIVRYQKHTATFYGLLEGQQVSEVLGDPFGKFKPGGKSELAQVKLLSPCQPSKIIGLARNYTDRVREIGATPPALPVIFLKPPSTVIGPGDAIRLPAQSQRVESGAELAVVIGRPAYRVSPEEALTYVGGLTCANDVTAVDLLEADGLGARGRSFDTFCALGPVIATGLDPADRLITGKVNGETRQMTSTHDIIFTVPQIVAFVSAIMTLLPGDVLLTGTPAGAGPLAAGDTVEIEIEGIGQLKNTAVADQ